MAEFDWRHYIRVEGPGERDPQSGALVLDAQFHKILERSPHAKEEVMAMLRQQEIVEAELDIAGQIPEFRENLIRGSVLSHSRLDGSSKLLGTEPPEDMRLVMEIGGSSDATQFAPYDNVVLISAYDLVKIQYTGEDLKQHPFTLLQAIVHEVGHYADPQNTVELEHERRGRAYQQSVGRLLKDFPEYAEEYKQHRTVAGLDFSKIEQADNVIVFDEAMKETLGLSRMDPNISYDGENLREAYERKFEGWDDSDLPQVLVQQYFSRVFEEESRSITERETEYPVMEQTYEALRAIYPDFPKRLGYESDRSNALEGISPFEEGYHERVTELFEAQSVAMAEAAVVNAPNSAPSHDNVLPVKP